MLTSRREWKRSNGLQRGYVNAQSKRIHNRPTECNSKSPSAQLHTTWHDLACGRTLRPWHRAQGGCVSLSNRPSSPRSSLVRRSPCVPTMEVRWRMRWPVRARVHMCATPVHVLNRMLSLTARRKKEGNTRRQCELGCNVLNRVLKSQGKKKRRKATSIA